MTASYAVTGEALRWSRRLPGPWTPAVVEEQGNRARSIYVAVWAAVVLKIMAAVLPLLALRPLRKSAWNRTVWALAWSAAAILISYGLAQTILAQLAIHGSAGADDRVWSAYLWDPWFLIFGLLVAAALVRGGHRRSPTQIE